MLPYQPRIAVVGGGPSGLTLGLLLLKRNIPVTIFELRPKPTEQALSEPAGMLDLHEESGLAAMQECDLLDTFYSHTGICSEHQVITNKNGDVIYKDEGGLESRPEISRNSLTKILLDQLPAESIRWEHKVVSTKHYIPTTGATEVELDFGMNGKHTFDLVIGADGTWSRVRNILTDTKPEYSGIQLITVTIREVTKKYPELAQYIGSGTFAALGLRHGITAQRGLQDSARIYISLTTSDERFGIVSGISISTPEQATRILLEDDSLLGQFGPKLKQLVRVACKEEAKDNSDKSLAVMPLYMLPPGHSWPHKPAVTLIGDASHVMCPWAAEGVNTAMWDALDLSHAITRAYESSPPDAASFQTTLDPLVQEFEKAMAARAKEKAEASASNSEIMFGTDDGAVAMAEWMKAAFAAASAVQVGVA